jgi:flavin-dependent dehydrogenase
MHDLTCDVLVAGAGLAGLETACGLAREGWDVILADRKADLSRGASTTGIFVRRTLTDFDFPESVLGPPVRDVSLYSPSGLRLDFSSRLEEFRVGRMGDLYRDRLQRCIRAGVRWIPSARLVSAACSAGVSRVLLEQDRKPMSVRATLLVGADGAASRVAGHLGLDRNRSWLVGAEDVHRCLEAPGLPRFHCFLDPRIAPGYIAWIVDDGEEFHIGLAGTSDRVDIRPAMEQFRRQAAALLGHRLGPLVERRAGRIPTGGVLARIGCREGFLVGDAAGAVSPLSAGGLDGAMRLSRFAVEVASEALRRGRPELLERYTGELVRPRMAVRAGMRRMYSAIETPLAAEAAFALLRFTPLRSFAHHIFFGRGSFPDLHLADAAGVASRASMPA